MKVRILDKNVTVYVDMDLNAPAVTEFVAGNEVELGKIAKKLGTQWVQVTLPNEKHGYIPGDTKVEKATGAILKASEVSSTRIPEPGGDEEAKIVLPSLVKGFVPDGALTVLGVAYWSTTGTAARTAFAKLVFSYFLGILGMILTGKQHRAGVLAVSETELFVVDLGKIVGEDVTLKKLKSALGPPSVKSARLSALRATCRDMGNSTVLSIQGALKLKATFPNSYESTNAATAAQIARAIQAARA